MKSYELANLIHISQGSLSDIENNKSLPSADTIAKLYQFSNINVIWLLTGQGPMTRDKPATEEMGPGGESYAFETPAAYGEDQTLNELVQRLIRIYRNGDSKKRAHLVGFLLGADPGE